MADAERRKIQGDLAFEAKLEGEARGRVEGRAEATVTGRGTESPAESPLWVRPHNSPNRRVRTRTHGGVTGKAREGLPMSMCAGHVQQLGAESPLAKPDTAEGSAKRKGVTATEEPGSAGCKAASGSLLRWRVREMGLCERRTSGSMTARSQSIKGAKRKSGGCALKAAELTPGGPRRVPRSRLRGG